MDIKGIKPVASRIKQRPFEAKSSSHFSGHPASLSARGAQTSRLTGPVQGSPQSAPTSAVPAQALLSASKQFPLPRYEEPVRPLKVVRKRHKRVTRKGMALRGAAVCFVLIATVGGLLAWNGYVKLHKVFRGTSTVAALSAKPVTPGLLKGEGDGRVNILLLGIGGPGHDGPDLTDTIMLLSVDPVNDSATFLSIPRDLWVQQPIPYISKQQKINAVYESGKYHYLGKMDSSNSNAAAVEAGFSNLDQVVEKVTGVNVNYHVLVNFQAFRQAIDTVGGVTVNVPTDLVDPTMAWENHNNPILAKAGVQQMNGIQALLYARSRETTSDFARGNRQRQILVALKDKVLTAGTLSNPAKLESLTNAFGDNVYSDMSTQGAERLYTIMNKIGDNKITSIGLTDKPHQVITTGHIGGISIDEPISGLNNYSDIQTFVRSQMPDGYITNEHAPVAVIGHDASGVQVAANLLKNYGYNVTAATTTDVKVKQLTLVDLSDGKDPFTLHYLQNRYGTAVTEMPVGVNVPPGSAKFVIIEP